MYDTSRVRYVHQTTDTKSATTEQKSATTDTKSATTDEKTDIGNQKVPPKFPSLAVKNVYELIKMNPTIKYSQMEDNLGLPRRTLARCIDWLKNNGYIDSIHSKVKGVWQIKI